MRKNYTLLVASTIFCLTSFSQGLLKNIDAKSERDHLPSAIREFDNGMLKRSKLRHPKVFQDTLYYSDFDGGMQGWTAINNNANNNIWIWDTVHKAGQFTAGFNRIGSTTGANGFMSLPSDFYNTPAPPTGSVAMDTYFVSEEISLVNLNNDTIDNPWVSFQQFLVYCCNSANELVIDVSTDSISWTSFNAIDNLPPNTLNAANAVAVANNIVNVSSAINGAHSMWIRFRSTGNSSYFWMIDDIAVIEGACSDLELSDDYLEFNGDNYDINPFYGQIPYDFFTPLFFSADILNNGGCNADNVSLNVSVDHTVFPNGSAGNGNVYAISDNLGTFLPLQDSVLSTDNLVRFVPLDVGTFDVTISTTMTQASQVPADELAFRQFATTDTVFARDDSTFGGGTGPASYVSNNGTPGGTTVGDRFGSVYVVESRTGNGGSTSIPTSISYRVSSDNRNVGIEIAPKLWKFDEDSLTLNAAFVSEVASAFVPYTVTINDLDTWLTLPFDAGSAVLNGLDTGQYVAGWEVTNLPAGTTFEVLNDASSAATQASVSSFVFLGHAPSEGWGVVNVNPGIRLNFGNMLTTGIAKNGSLESAFEVVPNPNNGRFGLNITSNQPSVYNLSVRNMIGQSVYGELLSVNGFFNKELDFSQLKKGVYFVSLESESEQLVKKVVIR